MSQTKILGEYAFRKTEMIAGFNFTAAGTFQFFFSYGAVDRSAAGTFTVEGNTIKLTSNKEAGKDFTVTAQSKDATGYTINFTHANKYLLQNIYCVFFVNGEKQEAVTDNKGEIHVDLAHCDSIYAKHLLFPDIVTLVKDAGNKNNRFTLALNPSLEQLSFKGIDLTIENDGSLSWLPNYFLEMSGVKFIKQ
ncbi:MAG: hypothetical protein IPO01_09260 [Chitinophagaceae bacterium]|nr:hypothetical protein [Chitinophagaceae bacterium]